jgi:hypothetical protein
MVRGKAPAKSSDARKAEVEKVETAETITFNDSRHSSVRVIRGASDRAAMVPGQPPRAGGMNLQVVSFADPRERPVSILRGSGSHPPDFDLFRPASVADLDRVAFVVDGAESSHMDPHSVLMGFRRKATSLGVRYLKDRVVDFEVGGKRVAAVRLASGERLAADSVINAANCWGPELCERLGMKVPVYPMRRLTFYFEIREKLEPMPLTRHISKNVSFRPQGAGYISGNTRYDEPPGFNWDVDYDYFDEAIWPGLAERVPAFEALKVTGAWAGHYSRTASITTRSSGRGLAGSRISTQ